MIFESLWPLLFLAAVPVIIILYLLKPKGKADLFKSALAEAAEKRAVQDFF